MRLLALFLVAAPVFADEVILDEVRAWRGRMEVEARSDPGKAGSGEGKLHLSLTGTIDPTTRRVTLKTGTKPDRLVAQTTLSGVDSKGLAAFRTVASRLSCLGGLEEHGELSEDGRAARGERSFVDRRGKYPRTITIRWSLERLDPEVKGRVLDADGAPAAGLRVLARTWGGGRMILKEAVTGDDGRFRIPAHFAAWGVQVVGREERGILTTGLVVPDGAVLRFDSVPDLELEVKRYRLALLPRPEMLAAHFKGDVDGYFEYVSRRSSAAILARAAVRRATN